jgi:hypothetical protein
MNSFKNPLVPLISNPVNIDRPIQELQSAIAALGWLEKAFGRAYESRKYSADQLKRVEVYPEVWQGPNMDLLNVLPNDNLKSQSFFKVEEPQTVLEYSSIGGYSLMQATVSIIFWFNLKEIDRDIDYRYIELLKGSAQRAITTATFSDPSDAISITRIWDTVDNVFRGYTLDPTKTQELIHPNGGFRFECLLTYQEDCPDASLPV